MLSGFQFAKQSSVPTMKPVHTQAENLRNGWNGSQAHGSKRNGEQFLLTLIKQIRNFWLEKKFDGKSVSDFSQLTNTK